jgi:hypothetical protein
MSVGGKHRSARAYANLKVRNDPPDENGRQEQLPARRSDIGPMASPSYFSAALYYM